MKKMVFNVLTAGLFFMFSCAEQPKEKEVTDDVLSLTIVEMVTNPMEYEGQHISFEGIIGHLCRHSGDKMRVLQEDDSDYSILVMLGKFADKFDTGFEGHHILAQGVLKTEVRELTVSDEQQDMHKHDEGRDHEHEHKEEFEHEEEYEHEHEPGDHACETTAKAVKKMQELGIDPEIRTFIELQSFEIK